MMSRVARKGKKLSALSYQFVPAMTRDETITNQSRECREGDLQI